MDRRTFLHQSSLSAAALATHPGLAWSNAPFQDLEVTLPRQRVPVSFIIDDSTALVNMAYYGIPQFKQTFPQQYLQDWQSLPREIPDAFVEEFIEWCDAHGVKGKYSMVPYPACTGWLHRFIPGWSQQALHDSLELVRKSVVPNWDIHPEMISHTRVIDLKTGLPYADSSPAFMENWEWSQEKSADELGEYLSYAFQVLKEAGFHCEGLTTPGGFCHRNKDNLALATLQSARHIHRTEIPHFFRDLYTDPEKSVAPQLYHVSGLDGPDPQCCVHIIGCTGDWFGGWDGLTPGDPDRFITEDLSQGRMVEVIDQGEPAIMVCHWPGIYYNGEKHGFKVFQTVVERLEAKYPEQLIWMKNSDIARYWAARTLTTISAGKGQWDFQAPFGTADFTVKLPGRQKGLRWTHQGEEKPLRQVEKRRDLRENTFVVEGTSTYACFELPRGRSALSTG